MVDSSTQCICLAMMVFPTSSKKKLSPNKIHELWWPPPHQHSAQLNPQKWAPPKLKKMEFGKIGLTYILCEEKHLYFPLFFWDGCWNPSNATDQPSSFGPKNLSQSARCWPKNYGNSRSTNSFESKITGFQHPINDDRNSHFLAGNWTNLHQKKHQVKNAKEAMFPGSFLVSISFGCWFTTTFETLGTSCEELDD